MTANQKELALNAEFFAAIAALNWIRPDSKIRLFTDKIDIAQIIYNFPEWFAFTPYAERFRKPAQQGILELLQQAKARHTMIFAEVARDGDQDPYISKRMQLVHNLSSQQAGIRRRKPKITIKKPKSMMAAIKEVSSSVPDADHPNIKALEEQGDTPITWPPKVGGTEPSP